MALVVEPRHRVVGLGGELRTGDAPVRQRLEHREAAAAQQAMQQRGDEDCLAGARKPRHAKPNCRMDEIFAEFGEGAGRKPRLFDDVGDDRRHGAQDVGFAADRRKSITDRQVTAAASRRLSASAARRI